MIIGIPKEMKIHEYRVGMTPSGVAEMKRDTHTILIEAGAGEGSGFTDNEYLDAGADIVDKATVFEKSELIVKVKEPLPSEYHLIKEGTAIFTYLHLAPNRELTQLLLRKKITSLGYETLQKNGTLPLLLPMSAIAGRMAPLVGSYYLQRSHGGTGVLPTGIAGIRPAKAVILGAGVVGFNAARVCVGLEMETIVINRGIERLERLSELFMGKIRTLPLTPRHIEEEIRDADIVVGAILVPGERTPILITRVMLETMKEGAVIVDVSIDQGGCAETSHPTTHSDPVYEVAKVLHYMVANMPGAYPRTSTLALTDATLTYIKTLVEKGVERAIKEDSAIRSALNTWGGEIVHKGLAQAFEKRES